MKRLLTFGILAVASLAQAQTAPAFGTYQKPFSADSLWNSYPVNPVFGAYQIPDTATSWDPVIAQGRWSTGIFEAKATDAPMVIYPRAGRAGVWDPDGEVLHNTITIPRWPAVTVGAAGSDGHADIVDAVGNKVYSIWQLQKDTSGRWTAHTIGWSPLSGSGWANPAHYHQGARAAGVPTSAGMIRKHEVNDGKDLYEHALAMSLDFTALTAAPDHFIYPATSGDTTVARANTGQIPEGARVMLPPSFNEALITDPRLRKVVKTLKKYGAYVVDRNDSTPFNIYVENGADWSYLFQSHQQLDWIRQQLRQVTSQSGFVNGVNVARAPDSNVNLLSLRGYWKVNSGLATEAGFYDTFSQSLKWGRTTTYMKQTNYAGGGLGRVKYAGPTAPNRYYFGVESIGGARVSMTILVNSVPQLTTPMLGNGQSQIVVWPAGGKATFTAEKYPGAPGFVKAKLIEMPAGK